MHGERLPRPSLHERSQEAIGGSYGKREPVTYDPVIGSLPTQIALIRLSELLKRERMWRWKGDLLGEVRQSWRMRVCVVQMHHTHEQIKIGDSVTNSQQFLIFGEFHIMYFDHIHPHFQSLPGPHPPPTLPIQLHVLSPTLSPTSPYYSTSFL